MNTIKQLFLFIISFVFIIVISELFIRNAKISEVSFAEYYDDIGKGLAKANTFVYFNEGFCITSTNVSRFIGKDVPREKRENTVRIALVGDSHVEALQVFERHHFGYLIEERLNKKFEKKNIKIEVLNFGRSSFNIGHMFAYQRLFIDKFNPDYVLYFISNADLNCDYSFPPLLPITTIEKDSLKTSINVKTKDLRVYQKTKFMTQKLAFANILNSCRRKFKKKETLPIIFGKFFQKSSSHIDSDTGNYEHDPITAKIINSLDSSTIIINRDNFKLPNKFKNLCLSKNLKYWELEPTFKLLEESGTIYNKWNVTNQLGHWNPKAHEAIGASISNQLIDLIETDYIDNKDL